MWWLELGMLPRLYCLCLMHSVSISWQSGGLKARGYVTGKALTAVPCSVSLGMT